MAIGLEKKTLNSNLINFKKLTYNHILLIWECWVNTPLLFLGLWIVASMQSSGKFLFMKHKFCQCHFSGVRHCTSSSTYLFYGPYIGVPFFHLKKGPEYYTRETTQAVILWIRVRFQGAFLFFWGTSLLLFLSLPFIWWYPLLIFRGTYSFLFFQVCSYFLIDLFFSFRCFSFPFFFQKQTIFFFSEFYYLQ